MWLLLVIIAVAFFIGFEYGRTHPSRKVTCGAVDTYREKLITAHFGDKEWVCLDVSDKWLTISTKMNTARWILQIAPPVSASVGDTLQITPYRENEGDECFAITPFGAVSITKKAAKKK